MLRKTGFLALAAIAFFCMANFVGAASPVRLRINTSHGLANAKGAVTDAGLSQAEVLVTASSPDNGKLSSREQRIEMDQRRRLAHNTFIDACNMGAEGEDNSWRADLGDDRKIIGDFACFVHCFLGIEAR